MKKIPVKIRLEDKTCKMFKTDLIKKTQVKFHLPECELREYVLKLPFPQKKVNQYLKQVLVFLE